MPRNKVREVSKQLRGTAGIRFPSISSQYDHRVSKNKRKTVFEIADSTSKKATTIYMRVYPKFIENCPDFAKIICRCFKSAYILLKELSKCVFTTSTWSGRPFSQCQQPGRFPEGGRSPQVGRHLSFFRRRSWLCMSLDSKSNLRRDRETDRRRDGQRPTDRQPRLPNTDPRTPPPEQTDRPTDGPKTCPGFSHVFTFSRATALHSEMS